MSAESSGKVALIAGITGQDGAYLARLLLAKGYAVHGTSRDATLARLGGLIALGICDKVKVHSMSPGDFQSVAQVVEVVAPDEIYNLSGQSSVSLSFTQPAETLTSIALGTLNMLETLRRLRGKVRFYNAGQHCRPRCDPRPTQIMSCHRSSVAPSLIIAQRTAGRHARGGDAGPTASNSCGDFATAPSARQSVDPITGRDGTITLADVGGSRKPRVSARSVGTSSGCLHCETHHQASRMVVQVSASAASMAGRGEKSAQRCL
jgi:GDP-mannose 4,6 dehydratase